MDDKYHKKNDIYVVGNNAAKLERYYQPNNTPIDEIDSSRNVHRRPSHGRAVKRYKYKMKFALILAVTMVMCLVMIKTQFTVKDTSDEIVRLENKLHELKTKNRLIKESINDSISLDQIYEIATTELGMVSPNKTQVNNFKIAEGSFTQQFSDITKPIKENNGIANIFGFILSKGR